MSVCACVCACMLVCVCKQFIHSMSVHLPESERTKTEENDDERKHQY